MRSTGNAGALAASLNGGRIVDSWARGRVRSPDSPRTSRIGGLIGSLDGMAEVRRSWFVGSVAGGGNIGGLAGEIANGAAVDVWALADVRGGENTGGLIGDVGASGTVSLAWAGGPVAGATVGGLFAEIDPNSDVTSNYWSTALSGIDASTGGDGEIGVLIMQTVLLDDAAGWSDDNWNFGDENDFPVLRSHQAGQQEFAIADFLTELRVFDRGRSQPLRAGGLHFLDSRDMPLEIVSGGMAADIFPALDNCGRVGRGIRANLGYNGLGASIVEEENRVRVARVGVPCSEADISVETPEAVDFTLAVEFGFIRGGDGEVLRREYYIDNFTANVDWLAETDGTIFAYQDDDGDGLLNAYDYEPGTETAIGGGNLTAGADGSREEPWPIFNIWQLQAIGGLLPLAAENLMMPNNADDARNLYGVDRMGGHYYLVADIEAASTREWMHEYTAADSSVSPVNAGFVPLVGEGALNGRASLTGAFGGRLDGRGRMIRDLFIDAERLSIAGGLFWAVDGGEIVATGLENVYARGAESAGAFAASVAVARAEGLWARGEVVGAEGAVGGLFGVAEGGDIVDSWFAGEVYGAADAGGLIGVARAASAANIWTAAQVAGRGDVGGAFGRADSVTVRGAFAAGAVGGGRGARAGGFVGSAQNVDFTSAYFDIGSTGQAAATPAIGVASLQTLGAGDLPAGWNVGEYDEYPILAAQRADRQIASLRRGLTRIVADGKNPLAGGLMRSNPIDSRARFEIDHNALAANDGGLCVFGGAAVTASFADGATVVLSSADGGDFAAAGGCGARLAGDEAVDAILRLVVARGSATIATDYRIENYAATIDWTAADAVSTLRALADDDDDDLPNAYDRSPAAGVDLSGGARGGFFDPYPIFNVWDLQAIDGRTPLGDAAPGATIIFGDSIAARLTASYYLASDIDAAPTRDWDYGDDKLGFDPIGSGTESFDGHFDGRGRLLRGLYVDSPDVRVGLFAVIGEDGSMTNVELENADISSSRTSNAYAGALAGGLQGEISNSAVIGRVHSDTNRVGGLVGFILAEQNYQGALRQSWFAGESVGNLHVGGLAAVMQGVAQDVWAIARVQVNDSANAGGLIGQMNIINNLVPLPTLANSWSGGSVDTSGGKSDSLVAVVLEGDVVASYWSTETSGIDSSAVASAIGVKTAQTLSIAQWSDAIWDFGDSDLSAFDGFAHFPALRALDRARQQIGASFGLTRILAIGVDGAAATVVVDRNETQTIDGAASVLVLDVNGLADDESTSADETSAPLCEFKNDAMEAQTNYGATVRLRAAAGAVLSLYGAARRCRVAVEADAGATVVLQAVFAAGEAAMTADYAFTTGFALDPTALPTLFEINSPAVPTRVPAMATMGAVVLTVDVFGNNPIAAVTDGDFLNDEGFTVRISLARPATAIFAVDESQPGVALTIDGIDNSGALVLFRSLPLAKDGAPTVVGIPFLSARAGMTAFADPSAQIFHFTGEVYDLQGDSNLFTVDRQSGAVSFVRDVGLQTAHEFTLFAEGAGLTASQSVRISVLTASEEDPYEYNLTVSCPQPRCKGSGTAGDPYRIYTIEQLQLVSGNDLPAAATLHLTAGEAVALSTRAATLFGGETERLAAHYRLANDIDARATRIWNGDAGFAPIGSGAPFSGNFDGDGNTIRGLYINRGSNIGLFAEALQANFVSVVLDEAEISGTATIGVLIGESGGSTVSAVSVRATVAATGAGAGGLIGVMVEVSGEPGGRVTDSSFTGAVSSSVYTGGLVGDLEEGGGTVSNSWSAGEIRGISDVGGLVGRLRDSVHSSRSSADVYASGDDSGGLVGRMTSNTRITDSNASGRVFSEGNNAGGLVGFMGTNASIERSWAAGAVSSSLQYTGGLVGRMESNASITDSNASGHVFSESDNAGGLVGLMGTSASIGISWSASAVSSRGQYTGGLVGRMGSNARITNSGASGRVFSEGDNVGGLVGLMGTNASIDLSWSAGEILSKGQYTGGLVGLMEAAASIDRSWSAGEISSSGDYTGGLIGSAGERATVSQSWSSGVLQSGISNIGVGGFVGRLSAPDALFDNNWSLTRIIEGDQVGGFVSAVATNATVSNSWVGGVCERSCRGFYRILPPGGDNIQNGYWSIETSGNTNTANNPNAIGVKTMRGVSITAWDADLWRFSDDGFPLLASVDGDLQAAGAALGLTRVFVARGGTRFNIPLSPFSTLVASDGLLLLDTNGAAANAAGFSRTGAPVCYFDDDDGVARAETGYNGATVQMTVIGEGVSLQEFGGCVFALSAAESNLSATVRIVAEAGAAALTLDYPIEAAAVTDDAGPAPSFQNPTLTLIIPAFAEDPTQILTLTVAGGFEEFSWRAIAGPFSAEGDETTTGIVEITVAATAFFTVDMQTVTAHIVAADTAARVASFIVDAKSAPRAINGTTYSINLTLINDIVPAGFTVISNENVRNEVWHYENETYSLSLNFDDLFGVDSDNGQISLAVDLAMTGSWNLDLLAIGGGVTATQTVVVLADHANNEAPTLSTTRFSVRFNAIVNDSVFTLSAQDAGAGRDGTTITFSMESTDFTLTNASSSAGANASVEIAILDNATNVFDTDGKTIVVTMTVTDNQALPMTSVVSLTIVSSPRPRDAAEIFFVRPDGMSENAVVLPSVRILASVWHSPDDDEIYEIESSDLFITLSNRDVVLSRAPTAPDDIGVHGLTLRILDRARAVTASQTVQVFVGIEPPLVYAGRDRGKGLGGDPGDPFLIYDIHQLQAVGGTIAPMVAASVAVALGVEKAVVIDIAQNLFGDGRATAVYQLARDIDARETRYWDRADDGDGFIPIGGFGGELRGAGKIIDGLYIRSTNAIAGLFAEARGATVSRLGLDNIEIDAAGINGIAGGLVAVWDQGLASVVWARGRVGGESRVGGLVGEFTNSTLTASWFAGEIDATNGNVGGLIGNLSNSSVRDNWAIGRVSVENQIIAAVGGLFGQAINSSVVNNWSGSSAENANNRDGVVSGNVFDSSFEQTYWGLEISGIPRGLNSPGIGISNLQTLSVAAWDDAWENLDTDENYPILSAHEGEDWPGEQALGVAFGLTRLLAINGDNPVELAPGRLNVAVDERYAVMQLDVNGFAPNNQSGQTPSANCESTMDNGRDGLSAMVYNGVTISMNVISEGAMVSSVGFCGLGWAVEPSPSNVLQTVRLHASVGDRDWTRDYPISLSVTLSLVDPISLKLEPVPLPINVDPGRAGVAYDANESTEVLTVRVSGGVRVYSFSVSNDNFALTGEGDARNLVLANDAMAIFTADEMSIEVGIEVFDALENNIGATVTVFSLPRPWPGDASIYSVPITAATAGLVVLPDVSVGTSIWHTPPGSGWALEYLLEGDENGYFGVNDNGEVSITLAPAIGNYNIALVQQAVFNGDMASVRATQNLRVEIIGDVFYYANDQRLGAGVESDPYLIYDIYQLQAIGGALPPGVQNPSVGAGEDEIAAAAAVLFGADAGARLGAHYRLAQDIDASPTRGWTGGFAPLAADDDFVGRFDGGGNRISDLFVDSAGNAGLFARIGAGGVVMSVGLVDATIILNDDSGESYAGVLAARVVDGGRVSVVWARGAQVDAVGAGAIAGGLVGYLSGASEVVDSWFSGEVEGMVAGGGLIGDGGLEAGGAVRANWAVARAQGATAGGFAARADGGEWLRNWSSGRAIGVDAAGFANPGMGVDVDDDLTMAFASNYWGENASGNTVTTGVLGSAIPTTQEIRDASWNDANEWSNVDDNNLFPVLSSQDADLQAVAIADGLVELLSFFGDDIATLDYRSGNTIAPTVSIRLDVNGAAMATVVKPTANCVADSSERILRASLFNGVSVHLQLSGFFNLSEQNGCDIEISQSDTPAFPQRANLIIFAGTVTVTREYTFGIDNEEASRVDYLDQDIIWLADDDDDGRINAYDRTPLGDGSNGFDFWHVQGVTLDGSTRDRAYPIYNIWHLQAMGGDALPPEVAASISAAATAAGVDIENEITAAREFFDPSAKALTASYQLARSFDAGAAREWNAGAGFTAIGGGDGGSFTGALYGVDFVIDGLFTRAPTGGLFARLGAGALVERVGLEGVDMEVSLRAIEQPQPLGAFAAYLTGATIAQSWARGRVVGEDSVGGLIGSATAGAAEISLSWFAGDVEARGDAVGGVAGYVGSDDAVIVDSWAVARVIGGAAVGGLVGRGDGGAARDSWAGGAVSVVDARTTMFGGLVGQSPFRGAQEIGIEESYWSIETSGVDGAAGSGRAFGTGVKTVQTLTVAGWSDVSWNFGDIDIDIDSSSADFPVLRSLPDARADFETRQDAAIAFGLTRVSWMTDGLDGFLRAGAPTAVVDGVTVTFDFNGLAAEDDSASPSQGVCSGEVSSRTIPVSLSYNGVGASIVFSPQVAFVRAEGSACAGVLRFVGGATEATVVVEYSSPGGVVAFAEYPLTTGEDALRAAFLAALESDTARWLDDDDGDLTINAYDHSPRPGVTLFGEGVAYGDASNPWPIYNIWQLQAIDGIVPAEVTAGLSPDAASASHAAGQTLYGADSTERLAGFYKMQVDIDATPTRAWDGGRGFAPIGDAVDAFRGAFDGGGNVVRGLRIDRANESNVGLFTALNATIANVGLDDARITGGSNVGAIVGSISIDGDLQTVWVRGRVQGGENVGGLAGRLDSAGLSSSWFAGQVEGDDAVGGLVGYALTGSDAVDSWAAVDIVAPIGSRAGELAGRADAAATLSRLWGEGYLSAGFSALGGDLAAVHTAGIRVLNDDAFQNAPIWNVGTSADFPVLTVHSAAMQGAAIASGLTRVLGGPLTAALEYGTINYVGDSARFSIEFADSIAPVVCSIVPVADFDASGALPLVAPPRQALVATLGYNGAEVRLLAPVEFSFDVAAEGDCVATLMPDDFVGEVVLEAQFIADGELLRREHRVFLGFSEERTDFFVENIDWIAGLFDGAPFAPLDDADRDGLPNAYDYTPLPGIDLTLRLNESLSGGENIGGKSAPYPIFNIWQLQAIGGTVQGVAAGDRQSGVLQTLFGTNLGSQRYRLSVDIDASPTRDWNDGKGFAPIRSPSPPGMFTGGLDGGGKVIRDLHINRPDEDGVGLFGAADRGDIADIGLQNATIVGRDWVGGIVGEGNNGFLIERSWAQGRVVGREGVGGIIGQIDVDLNAGGTVSQSWFVGDVVGAVAGGLAGTISRNASDAIVDSWAMARVRGATAGGLFGSESLDDDDDVRAGRNSWAGGVILGSVIAGGVSGSSTGGEAVTVYWDVETSGQDNSPGEGVGGHIGATLTVAAAVTLPATWSHTDGAYPTLLAHDADLQGAAILAGLTRLMAVESGELALTLQVGEENLIFGESTLRLDINGANPLQDAVCSIDDGALVAADVVNGASAFLLPPAGATLSLAAGGVGCEAQVNVQDVESLTMRFSAGAATLARVYRIESDLGVLRAAYLAAIGSDTARWLDDDDGDNTINAYDHSPRRGIFLFEEGITYGGADNPWPVYNIWQLQAIDGVVPAEATTGLSSDAASASHAAGLTLYGANSNARLGASYRLAVDIDATPTRNWDGGSGFEPIGVDDANRFSGEFDGGGNVVRGLRIDRAGQNNIGLFAAVDGGADRVVNLGLDDARITGGNRVGAIAGFIDNSSEVRAVWARGRVQGGVTVGGLIGDAISGNLMESWFAGQVEGNNRVGGLTGSGSVFTLEDSWAAVDIVAPAGMRAGELVGDGNFIGVLGNLRRLWGEGYLSSADFLASGADLVSVHTVGIRALNAAAFESAPNASVWNVGMDGADGDFPILTVHSESTQGAAIAYGLTRVMRDDDTPFVLSPAETAFVANSPTIIFDINGDEDNADPVCAPGADGAFATGYNNATISVSFPAGVSPAAAGVCGYVLTGFDFDSGEMTLTVSFVSGGDSIAREYPLLVDEEAAREAFFEAVEADPANWLLDPDKDGVISAYDYEPLGKSIFTLRAENANGEADGEPIPIYNVWQLQAIGGRVPSDASAAIAAIDSEKLAAAMTLFGENAERLTLRYRLATVIDARPTREWTDGFAAIVGTGGSFDDDERFVTANDDDYFRGELDGGGYSIRGLSVGFGGGLFYEIRSPGRVLNLGLENVIVEGGYLAGAMAGRVRSGATLVSVWAFGRVVSGNDASENVGGLVGALLGDIEGSWFAGDVSSSVGNAGGLAGNAVNGMVRTSWAAAEVEAALGAGGLAGISSSDFRLEDSWAVGLPRSSDSALAGGLIGDGVAAANVSDSFWDISSSGLEARADEAGVGVDLLATLAISSFDDANRFVKVGNSSYPVLSGTPISELRQRAAILFGLTRVFSGTVRLAASDITRLPLHEIEVDLNGAEANEDCDIDGRAQLSTLIYAGADLSLVDAASDGCFARLEQFLSEPRVLTIEFTAEGNDREVVTLRAEREIAYDGQTARAHYIANTDWAAEVDSTIYALRDDDGDTTINAYDWTPRGAEGDFDLRVVGGVTLDGSANRPYPVYNIWQLQAIDGVAPDDVTEAASQAAGQTLYGENEGVRLTASYRLEVDIDATPTRGWNSGSGFDPIGGAFSGVFDGGGNVVRGLRIDNAGSTVGLFAEIRSGGGRVQDVGLEDARVNGADIVGAIAGSLGDGGELRSVWARGRVTGDSQVGGLTGSNVNSTISSSWFAGQVTGDGQVGGLAGTVSSSNARIQNSWAAVDIVAMANAGELAGEITNDALLEHLWGEGFLSANSRPSGGVQTNVYYDDIRALGRNQLGGDFIWNVGSSAVDFPILTVHSRNLQGAAIAAGLTRIIGVNGATTATLTLDASVEQRLVSDFAAMRIEANTGDVPAPVCDFTDGALRAQTGFNGATVIMTLIAERWRLATRGGCDVNWVAKNSNANNDSVILRLIFVSRADFDAPETRLTTDYQLLTPGRNEELAASPLFVSLPARVTLPAFASADAPALTVTVAGPPSGLQIYALADGDFTVARQIMPTTFLATVSLASAATAIFDVDNKMVDVTLSLTHSGSATLATVKFVSTPRPIDAPPRTFVTVASEIAAGGHILVADTPPSIWHLDNTEERYTLAGLNAALFTVNGDDGSVQVGSSPITEESYEFELQLIGGGVTARQSIYVNLFTDANAAFLSTATMEWSSANAYDYGFEANGGTVQLSVVNGVTLDGTPEKPWPIYNIWQLQAVAGISVNADGDFSERNNFLGGDLGDDDHYRLMNDIDATATRGWGAGQTLGFYPIPDFSGGFDGGGRVIRNLYIDNNGDNVGLFAEISGSDSAFGRVMSVGLEAAHIVGGDGASADNVGAIVGSIGRGKMVEVWAIGRVESRRGRAGGLVGRDGSGAFSLDRGWFAGEVVESGSGNVTRNGGGLLGGSTGAANPQISDSWAVARVVTDGDGGGLVGDMNGGTVRRVWAGGAADGGLFGAASNAPNAPTVESAYWDKSTSGQDSSADDLGIGLEMALTLLASALDEGIWTTGDSNDYPILEGSDDWKNWQRLGITRGLTRLYGAINGGDSVPLTVDMTVTFSDTTGDLNARIDVNGEAPLTPTCTAKPSGEIGGVVTAPKYNGVSIEFVAQDGSSNPIGMSSNCSIVIPGMATDIPYKIIVTFTVGEGDSLKTIERRYLITRTSP